MLAAIQITDLPEDVQTHRLFHCIVSWHHSQSAKHLLYITPPSIWQPHTRMFGAQKLSHTGPHARAFFQFLKNHKMCKKQSQDSRQDKKAFAPLNPSNRGKPPGRGLKRPS